MEVTLMERESGVLLHISSLPSKYGIGSFGKAAYDFVDFLVETRQTYWQILPLTTTGYGDSPYSSYSAFAGNTNFIDFDLLIEAGHLAEEDLTDIHFGSNPNKVDYNLLNIERRPLLEKAVSHFTKEGGLEKSAFVDFTSENKKWLKPFAEYMTVKENFEQQAWFNWPEEYRMYDEKTIEDFCAQHQELMTYHYVTQFWFSEQWHQLKKYANDHFISIIGDIPIYVAHDSVEMWTASELFLVDESRTPLFVSGTPPDAFSDEGQYWGNPLYDWEYMEENEYEWWVWRVKASFNLYDVVRLDHFRGFEAYWQIPYKAPSAKDGKWVKGPDKTLFKTLNEKLGKLNIIAEDLGYITEEVEELLEFTGYPGMTILQHAFNGVNENEHMPHLYTNNLVSYVGTHDNETAYGWYLDSSNQAGRDLLDLYLNRKPGEHVADAFNRALAASVSDTIIYSMQDLLRLDNRARMNRPSTIGDNWDWRMEEKDLSIDLKERLILWTKTYFRENAIMKLAEEKAAKDKAEKLAKEAAKSEKKTEPAENSDTIKDEK